MRAFVKSCVATHGLWFCILFALVTLLFVALKCAMPVVYTGSYIDEYLHIMSGSDLFATGRFPEFYTRGEPYYRGAYMSIWVGLLVSLLGKSIWVAKLAPILIGMLSYLLVFAIARKVIADRKYVIVLLLAYTASPWVLFNHFYIRMYVVYELFLLVLLALGLRMIDAAGERRWRPFLWNTVLVLALNGFNLYFSRDKGMYLLALATTLLLCYVFIFEMRKMPVGTTSALSRGLGRLLALHPVWKAAIVVLVGLFLGWLLGVQNKIDFLLEGKISYSSRDDFKYNSFFGEKNAFYTLFFVFGVATAFFFKSSHQRLLAFIGGSLFVLHLFSSPDLQITRGILYFVPLFLLVGVMALSELRYVSNRLLFVLALLMLTDATIFSFPKEFLSHPYIPTEIYYVDYKKIYAAAKKDCRGAAIIDASPSEYIADFYGVPLDYVLSATGEARKNPMYHCYKHGSMCMTMRDGTPVIQRIPELAGIGRDLCLIVRQPSRLAFLPESFERFLENRTPAAAYENINLYRIKQQVIAAYVRQTEREKGPPEQPATAEP